MLVLVLWITPTCVGKSNRGDYLPSKDTDHPHVCGEKGGKKLWQIRSTGSPPRVWGKVCGMKEKLTLYGITPTCVGKRPKKLDSAKHMWDHPHVCGEKLSMPTHMRSTMGSPPRVWGKVDRIQAVAFRIGITPTCVGKSPPLAADMLALQDHPHVCGEKRTVSSAFSFVSGSPPRVWGKVCGNTQQSNCGGITPTCVGKRYTSHGPPYLIADHPHVCGEKCGNSINCYVIIGSPPRVWGKVKRVFLLEI